MQSFLGLHVAQVISRRALADISGASARAIAFATYARAERLPAPPPAPLPPPPARLPPPLLALAPPASPLPTASSVAQNPAGSSPIASQQVRQLAWTQVSIGIGSMTGPGIAKEEAMLRAAASAAARQPGATIVLHNFHGLFRVHSPLVMRECSLTFS